MPFFFCASVAATAIASRGWRKVTSSPSSFQHELESIAGWEGRFPSCAASFETISRLRMLNPIGYFLTSLFLSLPHSPFRQRTPSAGRTNKKGGQLARPFLIDAFRYFINMICFCIAVSFPSEERTTRRMVYTPDGAELPASHRASFVPAFRTPSSTIATSTPSAL